MTDASLAHWTETELLGLFMAILSRPGGLTPHDISELELIDREIRSREQL